VAGRDVRVVTLLDHPRLERQALVGGQLAHEVHEPDVLAELLDPRQVVFGRRHALHLQPPARAILGVATALGVGQLVQRDPEQPRVRASVARTEAPAAEQGGGEDLGRQVGGQLGVAGAAVQVRQHPVDVPAIEDGEGLRIRRQQLVVAARVGRAGRGHDGSIRYSRRSAL
jgi:hypothetical protein